jgi:predicted DCC family thiol-disulfide oxidoreductase YuxK
MWEHPIVFFDGFCGLCDRFISFVLKYDKNRVLRFSPIQGQTAPTYLPKSSIEKVNTIVFADESGLSEKSDAAIRIVMKMGKGWRLVGILYIFPSEFRDWLYDKVANRRFELFGKRDSCRIPTAAERNVFLD